MPSLVDRQVPAPVIGVAAIDDPVVHIDAVDHVRPRPGRGFKPRLVQPGAGLLEPGLRPDRHATHLIDQAAARNTGSEVKLDRQIVDHLGLGDAFLHRRGIGRQPLFQQQVMTEQHVMRRHRGAVRKPRLGPHVEDHPILALGVFDALGQKAIALGIGIRRHIAQQAFVHDRAQRAGPPLDGIGVHRIKGAEPRQGKLAALGRVGVHVIVVREVGAVFQIAEIGIPVALDDLLLRRQDPGPSQQDQHRQDQRGQDAVRHRPGNRLATATRVGIRGRAGGCRGGTGSDHRAHPLLERAALPHVIAT